MAIIRESTGLRNERLKAGGSSLADALANGIIRFYSGTIPSDPDAEITATTVVEITESGGTFTSGVATNGINLDTASAGVLSKDAAETWQGENASSATVGWGCFFANTVDLSASTTAIRFLFDISTSGATLNMTSTLLTVGEDTVISTFTLTQPE
jgi:hypothetical protein